MYWLSWIYFFIYVISHFITYQRYNSWPDIWWIVNLAFHSPLQINTNLPTISTWHSKTTGPTNFPIWAPFVRQSRFVRQDITFFRQASNTSWWRWPTKKPTKKDSSIPAQSLFVALGGVYVGVDGITGHPRRGIGWSSQNIFYTSFVGRHLDSPQTHIFGVNWVYKYCVRLYPLLYVEVHSKMPVGLAWPPVEALDCARLRGYLFYQLKIAPNLATRGQQ